MPAGLVHLEREKEPVELSLRMSLKERSGIASLREVSVPSSNGSLLPLSELVKVREGIEDKTIYHKNLKRVVYVTEMLQCCRESGIRHTEDERCN